MRGLTAAALTALAMTACGASTATGDHPGIVRSPRPVTIKANEPVGLTAVGHRVWTVDAGSGDVTRRTDELIDPVPVHVGDTPLRAAYDGHLLWVTVFGAGQVVAIDPSTAHVVRRVTVPGQPEGIVAAFGAVWVVRQGARLLTRISSDGKIGPSYHLGQEPRLVAAGAHDLFVSNFLDGTVTKVDPQSGKTETSSYICTGAQDLFDVGDVLWVSCTASDLVVAVYIGTMLEIGHVKVAGEPDALRFVGSRLYVVTTAGPALVAIDPQPRHPSIVTRTSLGDAAPLQDRANVDAVVMNGRWWVSSPSQNKVLVYTP